MNSEIQALAPEAVVLSEEPATVNLHHETPPEGEIDLEEKRSELAEGPQILAELVIEEVSIDGMCGVY